MSFKCKSINNTIYKLTSKLNSCENCDYNDKNT